MDKRILSLLSLTIVMLYTIFLNKIEKKISLPYHSLTLLLFICIRNIQFIITNISASDILMTYVYGYDCVMLHKRYICLLNRSVYVCVCVALAK